jgi:hypothetical protein
MQYVDEQYTLNEELPARFLNSSDAVSPQSVRGFQRLHNLKCYNETAYGANRAREIMEVCILFAA